MQELTICAICEYVAIYGRKPYARLLHRQIKKDREAIALKLGISKSHLEPEMPRAALRCLLTGVEEQEWQVSLVNVGHNIELFILHLESRI